MASPWTEESQKFGPEFFSCGDIEVDVKGSSSPSAVGREGEKKGWKEENEEARIRRKDERRERRRKDKKLRRRAGD